MVSVPGVRDLVEAEDHERRRLAGALTLGDPCPAEPARPGRAVVAALALGAITLAVGLLLDALSGTEPPWPSAGLVVSRESGSTYVVLDDGRVHPVTDGTSARLLLGQDAGPPVLVDRAEVDAHDPGARLGIAGAPASVPAPDRLVAGGWSACAVGDDEVVVGIGGALRTYAAGPPTAVTVRSSRGLAVVTTDDGGAALAYRLPGGPGEDNLLLALGLPGRDAALAVPTRWLRLVPAGGVLTDTAFVLPGLGDPVPYAGRGLPASARVGDWFPAPGGARLLTSSGPAVLSPVALAVWRTAATQAVGGPRELSVAAPPALPLVEAPYAAADWPTGLLRASTGSPCVGLRGGGVGLGSTDVSAGGDPVVVEPGRGSLVRIPGRTEPRRVLVADDGRAYPVVGADALEALGYAEVTPTVVPPGWLDLVERGPTLSVARALRSPVLRDPPEGR